MLLSPTKLSYTTHSIGLIGRTIIVLLILSAPSLSEAPWIDPGDRQARQDVELLKAFGLIDGTVSTWPMTWKQVERSISTLPPVPQYPGHVRRALYRLREGIDRANDHDKSSLTFDFGGTNRPRLVRGFDGGVRENADIRITADKYAGRFYSRISVGYRNDPTTSDINFDGSVAALAVGNWMFTAGFQEQWFGPSYDSALVLSNNTVPFRGSVFSAWTPNG